MKLLIAIIALLSGSAAIAADCSPQRLQFDMGDKIINTRQGDSGILLLKQMVKDDYGIVPAHYDIDSVRLVAKSRDGQGSATLVVGNGNQESARIEGHPTDFNSSRSESFYRYQLENLSRSSRGKWQIELEGIIKLKSLVVVVQEQNCGGNGGGGGGHHGSLTCRWNGQNNQPFDRNQSLFIGKVNHGFSYADGCQQAVDATKNNAVCNWNSSGYTPYGVYGNVNIGKPDHGFTQLSSCNTAVNDSKGDLLCNWTGSGYSPYRISNGINVGKPHYGFSSYGSCASAIQVQNSNVVCNWNGSNYQPYAIHSNSAIGVDGYGYTQVGVCQEAVRGISHYEVCNWDGSGYAKYHIDNPSRALARYRTLESCIRAH